MAVQSFVGTIRSLTTDAAATTYTLTPGFTTKAGIVFTVGRGDAADAAGRATHRTSVGFFTSTTNRGASGCMSVDAAAAGSGNEWLHMAAVSATYTTDTGTIDGALDVSSITSTTCVFIVDDVFPVDMTFGVLLFGGDSITNATVVEWDRGTGTGTLDITSVGFQGNVLFTVGTNELGPAPIGDGGGGQLFLGAATSTADEHVAWFGMDQGSASADTGRYALAGEVHYDVSGAIGSPGVGQNRDEFSAWLANGFQVNRLINGRASVNYISLVIAGGSWTVGDFTTRTTVGTIVESGFGYKPSGLLVCSVAGLASTSPNMVTDAEFTLGATDGATAIAMGLFDGDGFANMEVSTAIDFNKVYLNINGLHTVQGHIDVTSFDAGGFTLTQNDADPTAFFAWYVAAGPAVVAGGDNITGSDTATLTDTLTALQANVTRPDTATLTETLTALFVAWGLTDSATISETLTALNAALSLSDSATTSDALTALQVDATATDTGTLTDTLTAFSVAWQLADTATLTDTTAIAAATTPTDSAVVSDTLTALVGQISPTESVTVTEVASMLEVAWQLADTATLTDVLTALRADVAVTDTFTVTETGTAQEVGGVTNVSGSDPTTLTETATVRADVTVVDSLAVTEVGTIAADTTVTDSAAVSETFSLAAALSSTDSLSLSDTGALTADLSLSDALTVTDTLAYAVAWAVADTLTFTDTGTALLITPDVFAGKVLAVIDLLARLPGTPGVEPRIPSLPDLLARLRGTGDLR